MRVLLHVLMLLAVAAPPLPPPPNHISDRKEEAGMPAVLPSDVAVMSAGIESDISAKLDDKYEKLLRDAKSADDQIRDQLSLIINFTIVVLTVAALSFAMLAFVGWNLKKDAKKLVDDAKSDADEVLRKARAAQQDADGIRGKIDEYVRKGVGQLVTDVVWDQLRVTFSKLPPIKPEMPLASAPPLVLSPAIVMEHEEADTLLVLLDKIDALVVDPATAAGYFMKLARFWWIRRDWPHAMARSKRATTIVPDSAEAHYKYGICLSKVAFHQKELGAKLRCLADAERELLLAQRLGDDRSIVIYDLGWIYDERESYEEAIATYERAIARALIDNPTLPPTIEYNIACSLAKAHRLDESLERLARCIDLKNN